MLSIVHKRLLNADYNRVLKFLSYLGQGRKFF